MLLSWAARTPPHTSPGPQYLPHTLTLTDRGSVGWGHLQGITEAWQHTPPSASSKATMLQTCTHPMEPSAAVSTGASARDITEERVTLETVLPYRVGSTASTRGVPFAGGLKGISMDISIGRGGEGHRALILQQTGQQDKGTVQGTTWPVRTLKQSSATTKSTTATVHHSGQVNNSSLLSTCNSCVYQSMYTYVIQWNGPRTPTFSKRHS